jgi:hypothetical protein
MGWASSTRGRDKNAYEISVRKPEGKTPLGRPRLKWTGNIRMELRKIGWKGEDQIHLAQERDQWQLLVNTLINRRVPYKAGNLLTSLATISFPRRSLLYDVSESTIEARRNVLKA